MNIAILGSGIVGVTTAWYLQQQGHRVTVYDRQKTAGLETSFANGAQISVSHAEPWAGPGVPLKALTWHGNPQAPLVFKLHADWRQWWWGLQFLSQCTESAWRRNVDTIVQLGRFSRDALLELRNELNLDYTHHTNGILHVYESERELEQAMQNGKWMARWGVLKERLSAETVVTMFPELGHLQKSIVGATYTRSDEHGDAFEFTQALMARCLDAGVQFKWDCAIESLETRGSEYNSIDHVIYHDAQGKKHAIHADHYIVAMGSYTPKLLESIGSYAPIYPAKGYSATYTIKDPTRVPSLSITDEKRKVVFSRLNDNLRVAGTAEFNGWDTQLNWERTRALDNATRHWFGDAVDYSNPNYWTGLRPATPNNVPLIGPWKHYTNLWLNSGHGTLGWTHACGSAKSLAAQFSSNPSKYPWILTH